MNRRKNQIAFDNLITSALLVLIFLFANLNVSRSTLATDFSGSGLYTLQQPTIDLLKGVDDLLRIKFYHSPSLAPRTPEYVNLEQEVSNLLQLYKQYGGENVQVEVIDPTDGARRGIPSAVQNEMTRKGIVPMSETVQRQGQEQPYTFYSSLEISYAANDRIVNKIAHDDVANLENIISQEIQYALTPELVNIGLYVPPRIQQPRRRMRRGGSPPQPQRREDTRSYQDLETKLRDVGVVDRIFLEKGERFPDPKTSDLDVLLVLANRQIPKSDLYALDQYIMSGGKAIIAADPIGLKPSRSRMPMRRGGGERRGFLFTGNQNQKTLLDLLESYGAKGSKNVTLDQSEIRASIPVVREQTITLPSGRTETRRIQEMVSAEIPFMFKAKPVPAGKTPAFVDRVGQPLVMYPMSFEPVDDVKGVNYKAWFTTTNLSVEYKPSGGGGRMGSAMNQLHRETTQDFSIETTDRQKEKRDLVVSLSGSLSSAFSSDEIPESMKRTDDSSSGGDAASQDDGSSSSNGASSVQDGDSTSSSEEDAQEEGHVKSADSGELILTGDADMFKTSQMNRIFTTLLREQVNPSPNEIFSTGSVNHMGRSEEQELNLEREKTVTPNLAQLTDTQQAVFRILLIGLAPLLVILFGLLRWGMMRMGRTDIES